MKDDHLPPWTPDNLIFAKIGICKENMYSHGMRMQLSRTYLGWDMPWTELQRTAMVGAPECGAVQMRLCT